MLLRRISYKIALQFTGFVFLLFLINGAAFLLADLNNARRQAEIRLGNSFSFVANQLQSWPVFVPDNLPRPLKQRVRITDIRGTELYTGELYSGISSMSPQPGISEITVEGEEYRLLTAPIVIDGALRGYVQVADLARLPLTDLPQRVMTYLFVSVAISLLTFIVGLFFARRSLRPAEEMMQRLEQFTQDASHELRTPLAALRSSLDLATRSKQYEVGIISAKEDVIEITVLIERLLELARLDRFVLQKEAVDITTLARDLVEKYRPLALEKDVKVTLETAENITVYGDPALLRQVLTNLLTNAIKFNKPKGEVRVKLTKKRLMVEDTGIGIAPEALAHIFDRFFQADTSRAKDGFGLGLALARRIVELHGWSIGVKSKHGEGTTFTIAIG